ncbi:PLDc N-terminal domain-containing protein [Georgenia sp. EYE_87]|uniref:PLD nuclease N-terminal domain-containing protein n=1 Tax=Georgenia sp. EYE_87 TaxID=2853448 RepID=UPI002006A289|nr:PLD nuclease N-terminal domain-containing protein [Georgenia sp. EYE_87]MCK6209795.1 PLDc N-terminal domain-containing protein [Georgenia sp. EYE_87]
MPRILPVVLLIALVVYALIDCVRTPDDDMPVGIPKVLWVILIILFPGIAALAWIVVSRVARANAAKAAGPVRPGLWSSPTPPRPVRRSGPVAPDDDPEFLARLEADRRRAERERRQSLEGPGERKDASDDATTHEDRPGPTPSSPKGPTTPGTATGGETATDPGNDAPEGGTPRSPDEGTSEDGTSQSPGASQG